MRIALVGYGRMGKMVEQVATARGHEISAKFDINNNIAGEGLTEESLKGTDVVVDFSVPDAVLENVKKVLSLGVPVVVGATGWQANLDEVKELVAEQQGALVWSANFSLGVNLFFRVVKYAGELFSRFAEYDPFILEHHHKFKVDAPSGTGWILERELAGSYDRKIAAPVSIRAGFEPGMHEVGFDSEVDQIVLSHRARSRQGFAVGAVIAAEMIVNKKGCFEFPELLFGAGSAS